MSASQVSEPPPPQPPPGVYLKRAHCFVASPVEMDPGGQHSSGAAQRRKQRRMRSEVLYVVLRELKTVATGRERSASSSSAYGHRNDLSRGRGRSGCLTLKSRRGRWSICARLVVRRPCPCRSWQTGRRMVLTRQLSPSSYGAVWKIRGRRSSWRRRRRRRGSRR